MLERGFLSAPDCEAIAVHIVTESSDRLWSLASLSVAGEPRPRLCRVGDQLAGHRVESGLRSGTWLSALGVQNGDRIESINGFNPADPEKLLEAYARLRTASDLTVKLTRRGAPAELAVHVR
jgi:hypothetical protein